MVLHHLFLVWHVSVCFRHQLFLLWFNLGIPPINIHPQYDFHWFRLLDMFPATSDMFPASLFLTCVYLSSKSASPPEILPSLRLYRYLLFHPHLSNTHIPCIMFLWHSYVHILFYFVIHILSFHFVLFILRACLVWLSCMRVACLVCLSHMFCFVSTCSYVGILFLLVLV